MPTVHNLIDSTGTQGNRLISLLIIHTTNRLLRQGKFYRSSELTDNILHEICTLLENKADMVLTLFKSDKKIPDSSVQVAIQYITTFSTKAKLEHSIR